MRCVTWPGCSGAVWARFCWLTCCGAHLPMRTSIGHIWSLLNSTWPMLKWSLRVNVAMAVRHVASRRGNEFGELRLSCRNVSGICALLAEGRKSVSTALRERELGHANSFCLTELYYFWTNECLLLPMWLHNKHDLQVYYLRYLPFSVFCF